MGWLGPDTTSVVNPTEVELWIHFPLEFSFYVLLGPFCFISFLYHELYVLGDSSWIL